MIVGLNGCDWDARADLVRRRIADAPGDHGPEPDDWMPYPSEADARLRVVVDRTHFSEIVIGSRCSSALVLGESHSKPILLELQNYGPDSLSVVVFREEELIGGCKMRGSMSLGVLHAGNSKEWLVDGDNSVEVFALPNSVTFTPSVFKERHRTESRHGEEGPLGEFLLKRFLDKHRPHVEWEKIQEGREKTPDFFVSFDDLPMIWEVKVIANDDSNKNIDSALDKHGSYEGDTANIARVVQRRLKRARRQLGRYPEKEVPTVLVLVNLSQNDPRAVSPPAVAEMLYGSPAVFSNGVSLRTDPNSRRWSSLSAIAALEFHFENPPHDILLEHRKDELSRSPVTATLTIYHNRNADVPLDPKRIRRMRLLQEIPVEHSVSLDDFRGMPRTVLRHRYTLAMVSRA